MARNKFAEGGRRGKTERKPPAPPPPVEEPSVLKMERPVPPFVPPTNPPEFAVEQAVQLLGRWVMRQAWEASGRSEPLVTQKEIHLDTLVTRLRRAVKLVTYEDGKN
jgi:hypothetical protein